MKRKPLPFCIAPAVVLLLCAVPAPASAQTARLDGFVTDRANGQALELVNVVLQDAQGELQGAVTDRDGRYRLSRLRPGSYTLRVSFVGYESYTDTLLFAAGEVRTLNVALRPDEAYMDEVVVQGERTEGAARVTAGQQTIRPAEIELIPAPDISGDLAAYLAALPVTVASGDRGGQLFIRGGEPSQNLVMLDGMLVYQPFHILGFYSAFPSDILAKTDVYAGGYGAQFGERISSVIDVWSREGNKRRLAGSVSVSPFMGSLQLEGPLLPGRVSFLASARQSLVEQGAERLVDRPLPFDFGDAFAKIHAEMGSRSRLSLAGLTTHDRGVLRDRTGGVAPEEVRWRNQAASVRYVGLPRVIAASVALRLAYSRLESEQGPAGAPTRTTDIQNVQLALDATFGGERVSVDAGWAARLIGGESNLGEVFQNVAFNSFAINHLSFYLEPEVKVGALKVRPGARLEFYALKVDPVFEPRLRVLWAQGAHQISAAAGLYHQEIVGLTDQRDAASVFTAWANIPKSDPREPNVLTNRIPQALHGILGYRATPSSHVELSVEGYYKDLNNLFVAEWTSFPRYTTRLQPAEGRSVGFDTRLELRRPPFYGYVNYGYSDTRYTGKQASLALWFGSESLAYRPPHDRRHQLNALVNVEALGFDVSARWEFGSGLPFSRPLGFDGFVVVDDVALGPQTPWSRRVVYERPYNAVLPAYHRLDVSVERVFRAGPMDLTLLASAINVYNRRNIFFADVFTLERVDQLPFIPSVGLRVAFNRD